MKRIRYPIAIFVPVDSTITDVAIAIFKEHAILQCVQSILLLDDVAI